MAAFDFPSSPSVNQTYTANGVTWKWNGTMWMRVSGAGYLEKIEEGNSKIEVDDSGSGNVTVTTDGTEKLRIDSSGNLGLGTQTPNKNSWNKAVTLEGSSNCAYEISDNGTLAAAFALQGNDRIELMNFRAGPLTFKTQNTERLRIDSDGRLLLGLNASAGGNAIFQVHGSGNKKAQFHQPDTGNCHIQFTNTQTGTSSNNGVEIGLGGDEQAQIWNYYNSYFRIATNNTERLRITSDGNLGIGGLTNPGALISIPAGESNTPRLAIESAVDDNDFTITQYEDGNGTYTMLGQNVKLNSSGNNTILDSAHRTAAIQLDARNHGNVTFYTGAVNAVAERLCIFSDGNVRIGDTSINLAAVGSGPTLGINGSAPEITLRDSASGNPYAVMRTNDFGSLTLEADAGNNAANSTIHFRVDAAERMRINSSYLLHGDTASDLSGTHATMFCGSNHAFQHDGNSGTYLTIAVGAANGTVDLEADARSGGYPDMRFITTNSERVRIRANGDMTMRGSNSQYVEAAAFEQTSASKNAIVANNGGFVSFNPLRNTNSTIISHDPNSNSGRRITFPVAGAVHFSMYQDIIVSGTSGYTQCRLYKNGTADRYALITYTNGQWDSIIMNTVVEVAANDYLEFYYTGGTITAMDNASWCSYNFVFYPINTNRG